MCAQAVDSHSSLAAFYNHKHEGQEVAASKLCLSTVTSLRQFLSGLATKGQAIIVLFCFWSKDEF